MKNEMVNNEKCLIQQTDDRRTVTITMPLDIARTLHALIDGSLGTSDCDEFNRQMIPIRNKLERRIKKHYT